MKNKGRAGGCGSKEKTTERRGAKEQKTAKLEKITRKYESGERSDPRRKEEHEQIRTKEREKRRTAGGEEKGGKN